MQEKSELEIPEGGGGLPETTSIPSGSGRRPPEARRLSIEEKSEPSPQGGGGLPETTSIPSVSGRQPTEARKGLHHLNDWTAMAVALEACEMTFPWLISTNVYANEAIMERADPVPLISCEVDASFEGPHNVNEPIEMALQLGKLSSAFEAEFEGFFSTPSANLSSALRAKYGNVTNTAIDEKVSILLVYKRILDWALDAKHLVAIRFLLLGFELELYSPCDFCMVYWYSYSITLELQRNVPLEPLNEDHCYVPLEVKLLYHLAGGLFEMLGVLRKRGVFLFDPSDSEQVTQHFKVLEESGYVYDSSFKEALDLLTPTVLQESDNFMEALLIVTKLQIKFVSDESIVTGLDQIEQLIMCSEMTKLLTDFTTDAHMMSSMSFGLHRYFAAISIKVRVQEGLNLIGWLKSGLAKLLID